MATPTPTDPAAAPAAGSDDTMLTIVVKSPTDAPGTPDLTLRLPQTACVRDAKAALSQQHPRRPPPASQRLIHAGKLLADSAPLASTLTGTSPQVVHLVATPAAPTRVTRPARTAALPAPAPPAGGLQMNMQDVERAFSAVLHHQQRYQALLHAIPPATPGVVAAELSAVRAALAAYDASVRRQHDAIRAAPFHFAPPPGPARGWQQAPPPPAGAPPAAAPAGDDHIAVFGAGQQPVFRRHLVFQFDLHWGLLMKLVFFVFVLAQDGSQRRTKLLSLIAAVIYLWQTGHLGFVRRLFGVLLPSPNQLFSSLGAARDESVPVMWRLAVCFSYFYSFCYGFVCSLLPTWRPTPLPPLNHLVVNADEDGAHADAHADGAQPLADGRNAHAD